MKARKDPEHYLSNVPDLFPVLLLLFSPKPRQVPPVMGCQIPDQYHHHSSDHHAGTLPHNRYIHTYTMAPTMEAQA